MKSDGHLGRCYLKGVEGDAMNMIPAAAGQNLRKMLNPLRRFVRWFQSKLWCAINARFATSRQCDTLNHKHA